MQSKNQIKIFEQERRRLTGLAYRMTGSVMDAEDILQQAWIKFSEQDLSSLISPPHWLGTVVTRLCLDYLKSGVQQRETYVGAWLPDPLIQVNYQDAEHRWIVNEDVSIALLLTLHTLTPEMRAAFILRDAFDYTFEEIAEVLRRSVEACRQLVSRARRKLAGAEIPSGKISDDAIPIVTAFWRASREGDMQALLRLLAEDVEVHADGGGRVPAAINILKGVRRAAGLFVGLAKKRCGPVPPCPPLCVINGAPGFISSEAGGILQTTALGIQTLGIQNGKIAAVWIMRNPEKLRHLSWIDTVKELP